jgi:integrase
VKIQLRYVTERKNKNGASRWYWIRKGHPKVRLPDDENARIQRAAELNTSADNAGLVQRYAKGTVAWAVDDYRNSEEFAKRKPATRRAYERWLKVLQDKQGGRQLRELNRGNIKKLIKGVEAPGSKRHLAAVLARIVEVALDYEYLQSNTAEKLYLPTANKRDALWTDEAEVTFLASCEGDRHCRAMRLALLLLLYTGQRPCDVLAMTWKHYNGQSISVAKQEKTGARVEVACHSVLKAALDEAKRDANGIAIVAMPDGTRWGGMYFRERFALIRDAAGLEGLQSRDCRRTAVMRLYEVGATEGEIASITGHSIADVKNILNSVYFTRTAQLARQGIEKLERRGQGERTGDDRV